MALVKIGEEYIPFSNGLFITMTDNDYENWPDASKYIVCITDTKIIITIEGAKTICNKASAVINKVDKNRSGCGGLYITKTIGESISMTNYFNSNGVIESYITGPVSLSKMRAEYKDNICHLTSKFGLDASFEYIDYGLFVQLYENDKFYSSLITNHVGEVLITNNMIVDARIAYGHMIVKYENGEKYFIPLCYSVYCAYPCDLPFPSIMIKSARNIN